MTALYIGGTGSYVGEQEVGGSSFIHTASGSLAFTGTAIDYVHVNFTAVGSLVFSGHAPLTFLFNPFYSLELCHNNLNSAENGTLTVQ